ncbi:hypothetical protein RISK_002018 [Rhodopirellula islandica]|uniref:Uncharacterized protein n=1 Tax=Rhodopirellula islandica TaxID=595434 RepID=A0A0J1BI06_RHOIS|nr:hypothetical protein RISK_002018 [Rhodopirellula islandica]
MPSETGTELAFQISILEERCSKNPMRPRVRSIVPDGCRP